MINLPADPSRLTPLVFALQSSPMNLTPFYRRPGFRTAFGMAVFVAAYVGALKLSGADRGYLSIGLDVGLFLIVLVGTVALVAQFVLPVKSLADRGAVIQRLFDYLSGARGPVMYIRNGRTIESAGERGRRGSGVLLVDYASAGVLRTDTEFTRAIGPGVTFTVPGERLAEPLDLRLQCRRALGSTPSVDGGGQQPASLAMSEDGIPISADLTVWFMLDPGHTSTPRSGQFPHLPPYEFNPRAAERAVFGHTYREGADVPWSDLPLLVLIDLWREEAKRSRLEDFLGDGGSGGGSLETIEANLRARLVPPLEEASPEPDDADTAGREYRLLRARGIRVLDVRIEGLHVPEAVRAEHLRRWREGWEAGVDDRLSQGRQQARASQAAGERGAVKDLLSGLTQTLGGDLAGGQQPGRRDSLTAILTDALGLAQQPELLPEGAGLAQRARELIRQIGSLDEDCRPEIPEGEA